MSERRKIGDRVRLRGAPLCGVLRIADTPQNRNPWGCTGSCADAACVEWVDLEDEQGAGGVHANECDMESAEPQP